LEGCHFISSERCGKEKYVSLNREIIEPLFELVEEFSEAYCNGFNDCPNYK